MDVGTAFVPGATVERAWGVAEGTCRAGVRLHGGVDDGLDGRLLCWQEDRLLRRVEVVFDLRAEIVHAVPHPLMHRRNEVNANSHYDGQQIVSTYV